MKVLLALIFLAVSPGVALAQISETDRKWNEVVEPFRIIGNVYYVGAAEVTSFLITTPRGHMLLDGGFEATAPLVAANVEKLGFRVRDIEYILTSQAHYDHVGGVAALRQLTGAQVVTSREDAALLARGGLRDFGFGDRFPYPSVAADRLVGDRDRLRLGGVTMKAHLTKGHTKGCLTWELVTRDGGREYKVIFVGSASVPGYRLVGNAEYPGVIDDYRKTFVRLESLRPDLFLGAHGSFFKLKEKAAARPSAGTNPFIDPAGYREYVAETKRSFEQIVARQEAAAASQ